MNGFTDAPVDVQKIARLAGKCSADRIQLNTVTGPPADLCAQPVPMERLEELRSLFEPRVEVIAWKSVPETVLRSETVEERVCDLLARRPCMLADIALGLAMAPAQVLKFSTDSSRTHQCACLM